jgi:hypothetical protein
MGVKSNDDQELWESLYEIVKDYSEIASIQGLNYIFFPYQVNMAILITLTNCQSMHENIA